MRMSKWLRLTVLACAAVGLLFATGALRVTPDQIAELEGVPKRTTSGFGPFAYQTKLVGNQAAQIRACTSGNHIVLTWAHWFIRPSDATSDAVVAFSLFEIDSTNLSYGSYSPTDSIPGTFWVGGAPDSVGGTPQQIRAGHGQIYSWPHPWRCVVAADSDLVIRSCVSSGADTVVFACGGYEVKAD